MPAGRCRSSPRRRAFIVLYLRRQDRFEIGGVEYVSVCPLVTGVLHLASVHIIVLYLRRQDRFAGGGGEYVFVCPLAGGVASSRRRAFIILFFRRQDRFDGGGGEYVSVCPLAAVVLRRAGVHLSFCISAGKIVSTVAAENMFPCARWSLAFFTLPACIFDPVSLPARSFRRWRRRICLRVPASRCRSSPRRRAFIILYLRRQDRFAAGDVELAFVCPLAAVVLRRAGVHFSFCISAGKIVSTVAAENMFPCARWSLAFFTLPACIFDPVSLPARSFRRWRQRICLRVPASRCRSSPRRRAFIILYLRRQDRFEIGGVELASVCPLAAVVLRRAGVHFSFCISAGKIVSKLAAWNMSSCARWPVSFFALPACIYHSVSPPARSFRRWRQGISLCVPTGRCRSSPCRRAFFVLYLRRQDCFDGGGVEYVSVCPLAGVVLHLAGVHFSSHFFAGKIVSTMSVWNMSPYARWRLSFLATPACIFRSVSPPARSSRRCRWAICLRVPAGRCRSSPRRRTKGGCREIDSPLCYPNRKVRREADLCEEPKALPKFAECELLFC